MTTLLRPERGYILILVLVFLGILSALVMEELHNDTQRLKLLGAYRQQERLMQTAEEALQAAEQEIKQLSPAQWPVWHSVDDWRQATEREHCNAQGLCTTRVEIPDASNGCLPMATRLWYSPEVWRLAPEQRIDNPQGRLSTRRIIELRCYVDRPNTAGLRHFVPYFRVTVLARGYHKTLLLQSTLTQSVTASGALQRHTWVQLL